MKNPLYLQSKNQKVSAPFGSALGPVFSAPVLLGIRFYQRWISAPLHVFVGPNCGCRFYPTCSAYATEAIRVHGPFIGLALALWRLVKCTPLHSGGIDLVPARQALKRRCERVPATHFLS